MGYHEISVLIQTGDHAKARRLISDAYRKVGAVRQYAADELMVNQATLWRWVKKLDMEEALVRIAETAVKRGTKLERRGRPVGSKDRAPRRRRAKQEA